MSWTIQHLNDLNLNWEQDGTDPDLCIVNYRKQRMYVRLSACRITPIGVDISQTKKIVLLDRELPKYDFGLCRELANIIKRGTHNHSKTIWIRNQAGIPVGIK